MCRKRAAETAPEISRQNAAKWRRLATEFADIFRRRRLKENLQLPQKLAPVGIMGEQIRAPPENPRIPR